jgi:hypothetical protein
VIVSGACAGPDNVTVKVALTVPVCPSITETSLIEAVTGASSSVIVPVPRESPLIVTGPVELTRSTKKFSLVPSGSVSPLTTIVIWPLVAPWAMVSTVFGTPV